jgi:hypothetical protein
VAKNMQSSSRLTLTPASFSSASPTWPSRMTAGSILVLFDSGVRLDLEKVT